MPITTTEPEAPEVFSGTSVLQVIMDYCSVYVDDKRLQALASEDAPLFARRVWGLFRPAIPLFNHPAEMPIYLLGTPEEPNLQEPVYDSTIQTVTEDATGTITFELGEDFIGYELFCCRIRETDDFGNVVYYPTDNVAYDVDTGTVTVTASEDAPVANGTVYEMDFYTDGHFRYKLTYEQMTILGMCFQVVWQDRFNTDWLSMVSKIDDRSFTEQNRANKIRADTERLRELYAKLSSEMRRYEQVLAQRAALSRRMF